MSFLLPWTWVRSAVDDVGCEAEENRGKTVTYVACESCNRPESACVYGGGGVVAEKKAGVAEPVAGVAEPLPEPVAATQAQTTKPQERNVCIDCRYAQIQDDCQKLQADEAEWGKAKKLEQQKQEQQPTSPVVSTNYDHSVSTQPTRLARGFMDGGWITKSYELLTNALFASH